MQEYRRFSYVLAKVGQPAPAFTLPSTKGATSAKDLGKEISLSDYKGKWLIFFFYPLDFTFVCPTEILALSDRLSEFKDLDAEVLGASTDSVHSHFAWLNTPREKNGIAGTDYPLVPAPVAANPPLIRTAYIECDGEPLPDPDPSNPANKLFAWHLLIDWGREAGAE